MRHVFFPHVHRIVMDDEINRVNGTGPKPPHLNGGMGWGPPRMHEPSTPIQPFKLFEPMKLPEPFKLSEPMKLPEPFNLLEPIKLNEFEPLRKRRRYDPFE